MKNEYIEQNELYIVSDLPLAAVILAADFELVSIDKSNPKRCVFSFLNSLKLQELINKYWLRQLELNAVAIIEAQKFLKSQIYN